ncbi:MAG: urea transporter, partial [Bacteroidota bacterium]
MQLQRYLKACLLSYSQIFFSQNIGLAALLLLATFMNPVIGMMGLLSVLFALFIGDLIGLNQTYLNNGAYTYNVLLNGLALAGIMPITLPSVVFLLIASVLCLLISVWMSAFLNRFKLPFLSFPFIISVWIAVICVRKIHAFDADIQPNTFAIAFIEDLNITLHNHLPNMLGAFLKTLSMALFQNSSLAGFLIAIGLFIYSRIAFGISFVSFLIGAYTIAYFQQEPLFLSVHQSGFNYIFLSVSLCGYFLIPSLSSYLLALALAPLVFIFQVSLS